MIKSVSEKPAPAGRRSESGRTEPAGEWAWGWEDILANPRFENAREAETRQVNNDTGETHIHHVVPAGPMT